MRALGNIMHECSHDNFVKSSKWNRFYGHLIAVLLFECFDTYRKEHLAHHRYIGQTSKDPDYTKYKKIKLNCFQKNHWNVVFSILNPYCWFLSLQNIVLIRTQNRFIMNMKILYLIVLVLCGFFYFHFMMLYFVLPYVTSYQFFKLFSDFMDHDLAYYNTDIRYRALNHIFDWPILNWIFFPRQDAYHLVHHMYPKLPVSQYKERHFFLIKKNLLYASKNHSCSLQKLFPSGIHK